MPKSAPKPTLDVDKDPILINKLLGQRASIGPIPASQVFPWIMIGATSYFLVCMLLAAKLMIWFILWVWLAASWWMLTGDRAYRFFKSWVMPPGVDWINGELLFIAATEPGMWRRRQRSTPAGVQAKTRRGVQRFMTFQSFSHLHSIAEIRMGGHQFACLLLYNPSTKQWSAQIPFKFAGLHPQLYRHEIEAALEGIGRSLSQLFEGETLTWRMSCRSDIRKRAAELEQLATQTDIPAISVFLFNEQKKVAELSDRGIRQLWEQTVWASWTAQKSVQARTDLIGKVVNAIAHTLQSFARSFVGTEQEYFREFYVTLARQVYEFGYLAWRNLLKTKAELDIEPMTGIELWEWLWYQFNTQPYTAIPDIIRVSEDEHGLEQTIPVSGQKDILTRLIQGEAGQSSCPQHHRQHGYVYCNGRVGKVVVLEEPPSQWRSAREELRWIWSRLASAYVQDTEVVVQVSPRERWIVQDELEKMSRQSFTEGRRAIEEGTGKIVHADLQGEATADALRKILEGRKPLYCAPVFVLWRQTEREADEAATQLCHSFESAQAVVENDIAWRVWLETLPIHDFRLLTKYAAFSERRITIDSETIAGLLPLTCPHKLHDQGVEFLTEQGGAPIHVDLFSQPERILVTGATGSGKSVMGWRFIQQALALGIPVVGMDLSTGGNSTFQLAVEMLGPEMGAYIDILQVKNNLLEPPDLRGLDASIQVQRFKRWKDCARQVIVAIATRQIADEALKERVDSTALRLLEVFLADAEIIERYNSAFERGWRSAEWQAMPTLHDILRFCSKDKLGLESYEAIDALAINQIVSQISAKLIDPNIGDVIGQPSNVSPDPQIKFYALSGLTNDSNSFIMAMSAQMACLRNALAHPRSLFVGDELSVLLSKQGFAQLIGEQFATGRKEGLSILLLAQDLEAIVECSAAAKILSNLSLSLTGYITHAAVPAYINVLGIPAEVITPCATDKFRSHRAEFFTRWLIHRNGQSWAVQFRGAEMMVAALANGEDEKMARQRILSRYPQSDRGYLEGLSHFTREYVLAMKGSQRLQDIGLSGYEQFQSRQRSAPQPVLSGNGRMS